MNFSERTIEFLDRNGEVRDLDKELAIGGAAVLRALSGVKADFCNNLAVSTDESDDGLVMPSSHFHAMHSLLSGSSSSWTHLSANGGTDVFTQFSATPSTSNVRVSIPYTRVIFLESDEDSSDSFRGDSSVNATEDIHELNSSHSSDKYYNTSLDSIIAEHIRQEDEAIDVVSPTN